MEYQGIKMHKKYKPMYYSGTSVVSDDQEYNTLKEAVEGMRKRADRATYGKDDEYDYAKIEVVYTPETVWKDDDDVRKTTEFIRTL